MERFDIYLRGFTGSEPAELGLQRAFGIDRKRAAELVRALPRVVKRDVPSDQAARYERALASLGADFELRRSPIRPQPMISVSGGGTAPSDDLELPGPGWSQPPPPQLQPQPQPQPVVAQPARSLGATWSESRPPPRGPESAEHAPWSAPVLSRAPAPETVAFAAGRDGASAHGRALMGTLREAQPPAAAARAAAPPLHVGAATLPESQPPPPYRPPAADAARFTAEPPPLMPLATDAPPLSLAPLAMAPAPSAAPHSAQAGLSAAWAPIPLDDLKPAPVGGPPAAWRAGALDVDLRSGYVLDAQDGFEQGRRASAPAGGPDPFDPPPSLAPVARKPQRAPDPGAFAVPWTGTSSAEVRESRAAPAARAQPPAAVGLVAGRELAHEAEPSPFLRWLIRAGMGLSLFVIVTTARHCRAIETGVDDALARWGQPVEGAPGAAAGARQTVPGAIGPPALAWLASDLHIVSNGDKDRIVGLAQRLEHAGAAGVYVGAISSTGMVQIAGELIVQLPADPDRRKAVLEVHDKFLAAAFSGLQVAGNAPQGDVLRITL